MGKKIDGFVLTLALAGALYFFYRGAIESRILALSILPCALFLLFGILTRNLPLLAAVLLFAPCHILLSLQNALQKRHLKDDHA